MKITKEPTIKFDNHLGKLYVFKKAYPGNRFNDVRDTFNWHRNSMHGNHDRMIWDGDKNRKTKEQKKLLDEIGDHIKDSIGLDTLGTYNFLNHYKNRSSRTFWHRDGDFNPGEWVVMVTFGSPRILTFVDYMTDETYPVELGNGDIVAFNFEWNLNTFHAVEQTKDQVG